MALPQTHIEVVPDVERCVTCGAAAGTPYCASCGERRAADRPRSLAALVEEIWDAFSPVDGRIGRTLWSLVRRPGELTVAYMRGVRAPYMPPLRLFLIVNVLFFLHASLSLSTRVPVPGIGRVRLTFGGNRMLDTPLAVHLGGVAHKRVARRFLRERVPPRAGEDSAAYAARITRDYAPAFDRNSTTQAKSLVIALVPLFAVLVAALEWRRRRFALQDVVFATHTMAFLLLLVIAAQYVIGFPMGIALLAAHAHPTAGDVDTLLSFGVGTPLFVWLAIGLRRAYGDGRVAAGA